MARRRIFVLLVSLIIVSAVLPVRNAAGVVVSTQPMTWEESDLRYHAIVAALPRGTYSLVGRLVVEGWNVTLIGPEVLRR